ncbi:NAD-dependent epimerase/dehydratase family protein [Chryseobacterium taichungense]|uniref:NAD-dependent epimerase/dehydratase family protein n=1 Tax=Chryseobacterium taichungense TaxID=295069 RepID=UPI0028B0E04E|nr:NAD-dependent epimerase/dehydratase family protein [Chryseobacterium taichungense]
MKRILITGITGYIGGTVAKKLLDKNYQVIGLIRNDAQARELQAAGIETIVGDIHDETVLRDATSNADAIIHNADSADDAYTADGIVNALEGSGKTFIFTSGSAIFGGKENGEKSDFVFTEDIPLQPRLEMASRVLINQHILLAAKKYIRSIVIVPTMVYGEGLGMKKTSIQLPALINLSKEKGFGVYFGKGENIWSNIHIEDLADLYVLALEKAKAGSLYYAENGSSTIKNLAEKISERYKLQAAQSVTVQEAVNTFGPAGGYFGFASNSLCNADKARTELNWKPQHYSIENFI